jgi:hypothetical protein
MSLVDEMNGRGLCSVVRRWLRESMPEEVAERTRMCPVDVWPKMQVLASYEGI